MTYLKKMIGKMNHFREFAADSKDRKQALNREEGFTIIELLVTISIFSVIAMTLYSSFAGGIIVWKREKSFGRSAVLSRIFFERFTKDFRNMLPFSEIKFSGNKDFVAFSGLVNGSLEDSEKPYKQIGIVNYYYISPEETIYKDSLTYRNIAENRDRKGKRILTGVKDFRFSFYMYNSKTKEYSWADEWDEDDEKESDLTVRGIKVEMTLKGASGLDEKRSKMIRLSLGRIL